MSTSFANHASSPVQPRQIQEMESARNTKERRPPPIYPTDNETTIAKKPQRQKQLDKQSFQYVIRSGIAGAMAGCAAKTIVGPLDRVKILFQTSNPDFQKYAGSWNGLFRALRDIYSGEGSRGLFRGHSATLLRIGPYAGIKFLAYEQIRNVIIPSKEYETQLRRLISGSLAGMTSVLFAYPLEVVRVRLAFETKRDSRSSLTRICKEIYHEAPSIPSRPSINLTSSISSTVATGAATTVSNIASRTGIANFYRGFAPTLIGILPYAGVSFLTHDTASDWLRHPLIAEYTTIPAPPENPHPPLIYWAQLSAGGLAGLVGQTASYPLEIIRRRMQVGGALGNHERLGMIEVTTLDLSTKTPWSCPIYLKKPYSIVNHRTITNAVPRNIAEIPFSKLCSMGDKIQ
ncbi:MAG: hypothetical protein M1834_005294 [Cirrosporium novae-zelandiae]|nr:MAG: hypothetical protein M1834_005294 [Cirrosporium novae-zelandiae]